MIDPITQHILEMDKVERMSKIILENQPCNSTNWSPRCNAWHQQQNAQTMDNLVKVAAGAAVVAAAITAGGYLLYKKYLSQAARDCYHRAGQAKEICMLQHRIDGMAEQGNKLIQGKKYCKQSKDPQKCIDLINTKVNQIKKKIEKTAQKAGYAAQQYKRKMKSKK